jgi:nucleotide-binding universal stress UspA family protein
MRINNVPLVFTTTAIDRSFALLPNVAAFASVIGRPLRIVHVLGQRYRSYAERQMAAAIEALPSGNGLVFELLKIESKQRRAFLDEIASTTGGILAMLPTRHNFISRLLAMMSDYEKFMIEGPLPILALPRNGALPTSIERILFPLDLSPRSDDPLDQAADFAKSVGAELHLIYAFGDDRLLPSEMDMAARMAARSPRELYQIDKDRINALAERARSHGVPVVVSTTEGRAHTAILNYCNAEKIDLAIMATHGPRSNEDIWHGTTTARVIKHASIPVIAMRC